MGSCKKEVKVIRSFYFWKSNQRYFSNDEKTAVKDLSIQRLYVKFFEVEKDLSLGNKPISKSRLSLGAVSYEKDSLYYQALESLEVVPTVYIQNEVFKEISTSGIDSLAENVNFLIGKYYQKKYAQIPHRLEEIQIDCDWTGSTRGNYFVFLEKIKMLSELKVSCTLRLYPYKYPDKMGLPPVDKAMLMCYSLFNPLDRPNDNSIQDNAELKLYLKGANDYPIPLDVALPIFSWQLLYQNQQFKGVISDQIQNISDFTEKDDDLWHRVVKDTVVGDYYLRRGDMIKYESAQPAQLQETVTLLKESIDFNEEMAVSFFHLTFENLDSTQYEALANIYSSFSE